MAKTITCSIRCLEAETVRAAKGEMKGAAAGRVPFVCTLSGKKEEILLISDDAARRLATLIPALGGPLAQKIAAAILGAELCECDIATLTESDEGRVLDELERLEAIGVARSRKIEGMTYYALAAGETRDLLDARISELAAA